MNLQTESAVMNKVGASSHATWQSLTDAQRNERQFLPTLTLDEQGFVRECDKSVKTLFGYCQNELVWQHISCLFPKLTEFSLMEGNRLNPLLNHIRHRDYEYEAINKQSSIMKCNLDFILVEHKGMLTVWLIVRFVADSHS